MALCQGVVIDARFAEGVHGCGPRGAGSSKKKVNYYLFLLVVVEITSNKKRKSSSRVAKYAVDMATGT